MAWSPSWRVAALCAKAVEGAGLALFPGACSAAGCSLEPATRAFLEENTEATRSGSLTPEIELRLLTPRCRFWWEQAELWPYTDPYWAIYWPGGQALSRYFPGKPSHPRGSLGPAVYTLQKLLYILDNPDTVRGKSVLDLGSGCGATAIAAKMSGSSRILANDIDPLAGVATALNCELNHLSPFPVSTQDIVGSEPAPWDLVVLGDMFYDDELANRLQQWLKRCVRTHGTRILIGDPGRPQLSGHSIQQQLCRVAEYPLPEPTRQENYGLTAATVWEFQP